MNLAETLNPTRINTLVSESLMATKRDVEAVLNKQRLSVHDLPILLSPAAESYLEVMATRAHNITVQRFGYTMQLFAPMYISNECYNTCTYCGFSMEHKYKRKTLNPSEIKDEVTVLKKKGFDHILVLTGESPKAVDANFIANSIDHIAPHFSSVSIEVQPLSEEEYKMLIGRGVDSLTLYQETYHPEAYAKYHLFGLKKDYKNRLDASERGARAGFYRIGLGALLGLHDWRYDSIALSQHLAFMRKHYWQTKYSASFNRINDMFGEFTPEYAVSDSNLVQLITAFRLVFHDLSITMSTREPEELRDNLIPLGITTMSAESNTAPGGYSGQEEEKQFEISDERSIDDVKAILKQKGYEPVVKDWDPTFIIER
jgi:2-iminoacetate synthase